MSTPHRDSSAHTDRHVIASHLRAAEIAEQSIMKDLEDEDNDAVIEDGNAHLPILRSAARRLSRGEYSMAGSYRRVSAVAFGPRPLFTAAQPPEASRFISEQDREAALQDERSLLRDNELIPPKHPRKASDASDDSGFLHRKMSIRSFIPRRASHAVNGESAIHDGEPTERTPLVRDASAPYGGEDTPDNINKKWDEAIAAGMIHTTWQREAKVLAKYSRSLILTFLLQFSLNICSVFVVGHIGKTELGAVSLGTMSANISGFAIYIGLATSLDTLCAQAYGSGNKKLVGIQVQRMVVFLWAITIPIAILWSFGPQILRMITPEKEIADLAGLYLRINIIGAPGYAAFESGKRFVQAQGLFQATMYCLIICAPLNAFLQWLLVWHFELGFIGAPISIAIVDNLLPICLMIYVRFVDGLECWPGISKRAFQNWWPMIRLALPGLVMVMAEFLAFEVLTLASSYISATHLGAQSILGTISAITYAIPFPISIASSTRIANLIGATLDDAAKVAARVALVVALLVGVGNALLLIAIRDYVPYLFTNDQEVAALTAKVLPINAAFQLFDALAALANGVLRGLGRQEIGGVVNIICYYLIAMPLSFGLCFGAGYDLYGLWTGPALALGLVAGVEGYFIYKMDWKKAVDAATERNAMS